MTNRSGAGTAGTQTLLTDPYELSIFHGYPVITATECEGWYFGAISDLVEFKNFDSGDGYVIAPDGSRAELLWQIGKGDITQVLPPDEQRWGAYAVWFPKSIRTLDDLVFGFRYILPNLQKFYFDIQND